MENEQLLLKKCSIWVQYTKSREVLSSQVKTDLELKYFG